MGKYRKAKRKFIRLHYRRDWATGWHVSECKVCHCLIPNKSRDGHMTAHAIKIVVTDHV